MRRRLLVMRHAKSSWKSAAASDHDRPLNRRGRGAAPLVAARIREIGWSPDAVLSSDAQRTRETWARCAPELPPPAYLRFSPTLYFGSLQAVRRELAMVPDEHHTLLTLGHNPGWEQLAQWLCGDAVLLKTADVILLEAPLSTWRAGLDEPGQWSRSQHIRARAVTEKG
jgi:phosphohistidine phosphatase